MDDSLNHPFPAAYHPVRATRRVAPTNPISSVYQNGASGLIRGQFMNCPYKITSACQQYKDNLLKGLFLKCSFQHHFP